MDFCLNGVYMPSEIGSLILKYLPAHSISKMKEVSKYWLNSISNTPFSERIFAAKHLSQAYKISCRLEFIEDRVFLLTEIAKLDPQLILTESIKKIILDCKDTSEWTFTRNKCLFALAKINSRYLDLAKEIIFYKEIKIYKDLTERFLNILASYDTQAAHEMSADSSIYQLDKKQVEILINLANPNFEFTLEAAEEVFKNLFSKYYFLKKFPLHCLKYIYSIAENPEDKKKILFLMAKKDPTFLQQAIDDFNEFELLIELQAIHHLEEAKKLAEEKKDKFTCNCIYILLMIAKYSPSEIKYLEDSLIEYKNFMKKRVSSSPFIISYDIINWEFQAALLHVKIAKLALKNIPKNSPILIYSESSSH